MREASVTSTRSRLECIMTRNSAMAERRLVQSSSPSRRSWLVLLLAAAILAIIVLGGNAMPAGSAWIAGCTALAVVLWFVARSVVQRVDHRHTEAKMVNEVKAYLQGQPAEPVARPATAGPPKRPVDHPEEAVPRQSAGFMPLK